MLCNKIWPKPQVKRGWVTGAIPCSPDSELYGHPDSNTDSAWQDDKFRWSQGRPMEKGDWYILYFEKSRAISEVIVTSRDIRFPKKFNLSVAMTRDGDWEIEVENEEMTGFNQSGNAISFKHRFSKGRKIAGIRLDIVEPNKEVWLEGKGKGHTAPWAIYSIKFKEYLFFSRLGEHKIE
jgi:hypothetical protein